MGSPADAEEPTGIETLDEVEGARVLLWNARTVGYDGPAEGGERESFALLASPETLAFMRIGGECLPSLSEYAKVSVGRSGGECEPDDKLEPCRDEKDTA